jgi:serine/threonine protein kinase
MGAVWLGRDEVLGRQVALKQIGLLPGADHADLARAEREARLSPRHNHPHVVAVFDSVVDPETDARWLVMEYVDGATLGQLVRRGGPLSPDDAAPLLRETADALAAAHAAGIVHRDVKPSNILVDRTWRVKLTDFGIARIAADPSLTQTGLLTGSPAYLAPEVATGKIVDQAVDVWSLGATAYYVLSGRPPYETSDNVLSTLYRIVNDEPPQLADAGWMAPLLQSTMVKDPTRRWSMEQVRDFLADPPKDGVVATNTWVPPVEDDDQTVVTQQLTSAGRRRPPVMALVVAAALVLAIVAGVGLYALLSSDSKAPQANTAPPSDKPSATRSAAPAKPTEAGMESFIRDYVSTVSSDPQQSWKMLTPKFQQESGGFETYRAFWDKATNGRVLSISANPKDLAVSYQVHFDNFDNGPGPTVLDLKFKDGNYLIDGEHTQGFKPAG